MKFPDRIFLLVLAAALAVAMPLDAAKKKKTTSAAKAKPKTEKVKSVSDMEKQKQAAEAEIKLTKEELAGNEKKVSEGLSALRKLDSDIAVSQAEVETVQGQLDAINGKITSLEGNISLEESRLKELREEYLKAVKKMRVAGKKSSGLAFVFASKNFNEARRRMRYMQEFSEWKDRRTGEINGIVTSLKDQRAQLVQAQNDAAIALHRQVAARDKLSAQKREQQKAVDNLRANSETLKGKLARRQAEARQLSNQISALIAQERERQLAAEREAAEKQRLAAEQERQRLAAEKEAAQKAAAQKEKEQLASKETKKSEKSNKSEKSEKAKETKQTSKSSGTEYADARKRKPRSSQSEASAPAAPAGSSFADMKGRLPRPVSGSFKIVSAFGVHPISPELPDIMDENLGIDAHVANGASACAVFDGEVIKVYDRTNTPGFRNIIVVKHGDYITVYANLETLNVKAGQKVKQGQSLGTVGADFDDPDYGLIHFEVWKNQLHLDPAAWIV